MSVMVNLQCSGLAKGGMLGQRKPMMVLHSRTENTPWREVGRTEPSPNRVNPKFIYYYVFRADQVAITLLRAEIFSVDTGNPFAKKQLLGERTIALVDLLISHDAPDHVQDSPDAPAPALPASSPFADAPLPPSVSAVHKGPTLRLVAQRIVPVRQHKLMISFGVFGLNLQSFGWTYVVSRVSSTDENTRIPIFASELLCGKGYFQTAAIATECLCDAYDTVLAVDLFLAGSSRPVGELRAPLHCLLEVDVTDLRPMWHELLYVRMEDGEIQIARNEIDNDLIHLAFRVNSRRGERSSLSRTISKSLSALSPVGARSNSTKQLEIKSGPSTKALPSSAPPRGGGGAGGSARRKSREGENKLQRSSSYEDCIGSSRRNNSMRGFGFKGAAPRYS